MQVSEKERQVELGALFKDVATVIVEKCINPETQRPYTVGLIERGLKDIHFAVDPKRSAKQQVWPPSDPRHLQGRTCAPNDTPSQSHAQRRGQHPMPSLRHNGPGAGIQADPLSHTLTPWCKAPHDALCAGTS